MFDKLREVLGLSLIKTDDINVTIGALIAVVFAFILSSFTLRLIRKLITRNLPIDDTNKFISIFQFIKYLVYIFVTMFALRISGVDISVLLTASAAIFIGLGFALQQLFQDLIAGVLIILDQSLKVGDIIEIDGKVGRVQRISLRSTRAYTRNDRVMIIPNHMFMDDLLFNWTQNNNLVRDSVSVGVAYGSDTALTKKLLLESSAEVEAILKEPRGAVLFDNFGESSLDFTVNFYVNDAFAVQRIKSDLRFVIDRKFREHNISIPFPQRDLHIYQDKNLAFSIKEKQNNTEE
ncbi:mechanosensitive ion channel family protein [Flavobacterium tegetincola]|uniref:mechanosensitive ion channel family protein n=1 Tax=Flavobacterium tegetincola TaxID=150172 RepID=UPI000688DA9A|nr:mechanosensitive ion channel domain-containing protein [Flavobacterium tegetincola]